MRHKILIHPHPYLDPVQNMIQNRIDVEFIKLGSAIQHYLSEGNTESYTTLERFNLTNYLSTGFPSWLSML